MSGRHSEPVAPLGVAHVRGEAVIQSVSWAHKKHRQVRTPQTGKGPCGLPTKQIKPTPKSSQHSARRVCVAWHPFATWELKVFPLLLGPTEAVPVLLEVAAAGHGQLVTAFLRVALRVELDGEVDGPRDVNSVLGGETRTRRRHWSLVSSRGLPHAVSCGQNWA